MWTACVMLDVHVCMRACPRSRLIAYLWPGLCVRRLSGLKRRGLNRRLPRSKSWDFVGRPRAMPWKARHTALEGVVARTWISSDGCGKRRRNVQEGCRRTVWKEVKGLKAL